MSLARRVRAGGIGAWTSWLIVAAIAGIALRGYRVDSSLEAWFDSSPATNIVRSYLVVGLPGSEQDAALIAARLRDLPCVKWCVDPALVRSAGHFSGVTPDDFVIGPSGLYVGLFVFPRDGIGDERFIEDVRQAIDAMGDVDPGTVALGGPTAYHAAMNRWSQHRLPLIVGLILLVGMVGAWRITGSRRIAVAGTGAIALSQLILLGAACAARHPIDMALSLVPPLMMALGYSFVVHRALRPASGGAIALSALTSAAGIGAFACSGLPPLRDFALFGVAGLFLTWLAVITLVPAATTPGRRRGRSRIDRVLERIIGRHARATVITGIIVSAAGLAALARLQFESDALTLMPARDPFVRDMKTLDDRLTGMLPFVVAVDGPADPTAMLASTPGVRKVVDVSPLIPGSTRHFWCLADNEALPDLVAAEMDWQRWAAKNEVQLTFTGVAAQLASIGRIVVRTAIATLPAMALFAALIGGLVARCGRFAMLSVWVNLLPVGGAAIAAWALDLRLNPLSLMIGAIAVGVAMDDTIHLAASYRATRSVSAAWRRCRRACLASSMLVAACLCLFALSDFDPTRQFGVLLAAAVLAAATGDLLFLPASMRLSKRGCRSRPAVTRSLPQGPRELVQFHRDKHGQGEAEQREPGLGADRGCLQHVPQAGKVHGQHVHQQRADCPGQQDRAPQR